MRSRRYAATHAPVAVALWQNAIAAAVLAPFVVAGAAAMPAITAHDVMLLLVLGILCTALAHTLFIGSLRRVSAHTASVVAALEPVYGIALAVAAAGRGAVAADTRRCAADRGGGARGHATGRVKRVW